MLFDSRKKIWNISVSPLQPSYHIFEQGQNMRSVKLSFHLRIKLRYRECGVILPRLVHIPVPYGNGL
jgi:hypothetical protein